MTKEKVINNNLNSLFELIKDNDLLFNKNKKNKLRYGLADVYLKSIYADISSILSAGFSKKICFEILQKQNLIPNQITQQQFYLFLKKQKETGINNSIPLNVHPKENVIHKRSPVTDNDQQSFISDNKANNVLQTIEAERNIRMQKERDEITRLANENGKEVSVVISKDEYPFVHIPKRLTVLNESDAHYPHEYPAKFRTRIHPEGGVPWQMSLPVLVSEDGELFELYSQLPILPAYSPFSSDALIDYEANVVSILIYANRLKKSYEETGKIIRGRKIL